MKVKTYLKRVTTVITAGIMIFSLVACNQANKNNDSQNTQESQGGQVNSNLKEIRIGTLNSKTGNFANGGGLDSYYGQQVAINMINSKGGVLGKYKIVAVDADDKSLPEEGVKEAERLATVEKVPIVSGVFASAIAVPVSEALEKNKTIFWDHVAVSDAVVQNKHNKYVFRPQILGTYWGKPAVDFINANYKLFGVEKPSDIKVAILNENGPYGTSCAQGSMTRIAQYNMKVVYQQSYERNSKDIKDVVKKLVESKPDVLFQTSYRSDLELFFKTAKEQKLKVKAIVGQGAGHSFLSELEKSAGKDVTEYLFNSEGPFMQLLPKDKVNEDIYNINQEALALGKSTYNVNNPSAYFTAAFSSNWILFEKVLPIAIEKYGDVTPDTVAKACAEISIPEKSTPAGYGVKFAANEDEFAGQNTEAFPNVMQWYQGKWHLVWPLSFKENEPVIPLKNNIFAK